MGDRGPVPRKGLPTAIRFDPALKEALQAAAAANGVTLSGEIENRLRQSFINDHAEGARCEVDALVAGLRLAIDEVETLTGQEWQVDGFTRDAVADAVQWLVRKLGPNFDHGVSPPPSTFPTWMDWTENETLKRDAANELIKQGVGKEIAKTIIRSMGTPIHPKHPWRMYLELTFKNNRTLGAILQHHIRVSHVEAKERGDGD